MTEFPLFRLSFVPLEVVIDKMHIGDLIRLHFCSKKSRASLRTRKTPVSVDSLSSDQKQQMNVFDIFDLFRLERQTNPNGPFGNSPKQHLTTTITVGDGIKVKFDNDYRYGNTYQEYFNFFINVERISQQNVSVGTKEFLKLGDGITVPVVMTEKRNMITFWDDLSDGLNEVINYVKKYFKSQTIDCCINGSEKPEFSGNLRESIKWMNEQTIDNLYVYVLNMKLISDDDYKYILDNIHLKIRFEHEQKIINTRRNKFQHDFPQFKTKYFKLNPANWFTLDNLKALDCEEILLMKSKLTNDDIKEYLKVWMGGRYPKLQRLVVQLKEALNLQSIFSELSNYLQDEYYIEEGVHRAPDRDNENCVFIKRHNQIVARIAETRNFLIRLPNVVEPNVLEFRVLKQ